VPAVVFNATIEPPDVRLCSSASRRRTVIIEVLEPSAGIEPGDAEMIESAALAAPAVNATDASSVTADPPSVPAVAESTTSPPLEIRLFSFGSFNCTVTVDVVTPLAVIDADEAVIVDRTVLAGPGVSATAASSLNVPPSSVPETVAVPTVVGDVKTAVYVPSYLSVTTPRFDRWCRYMLQCPSRP